MSLQQLVFAMVVASFCLAVQPAAAVHFGNPAFAPEGAPSAIPIGHYRFCKTTPNECSQNDKPIDATILTSSIWDELTRINGEVNAAVAPVTDLDQYDTDEYWTYPQGAGDCEDYALEKRKELMTRGWAASTLLIAVVRQKSGAGHAVLIARTDRGDLVLDNQDGDIHLWNETPYTYLKRQSQANSGEWVEILDQRTVLVAAAH